METKTGPVRTNSKVLRDREGQAFRSTSSATCMTFKVNFPFSQNINECLISLYSTGGTVSQFEL